MARILIETHGCTLNQADSEIMGSILEESGASVEHGPYSTESPDSYDYVIINTCTVKKQTEQRIRGRLERFRGLGRRLVVTGCLASANPDIVRKAAPDASMLNTSNIARISDLLVSESKIDYRAYGGVQKPALIRPTGSVIARIPISEGCLSSCSFCETKFARGPLNSFKEEVILRAAAMSIGAGSREIELTSQDVGAYGADRRTNIAELAAKISGLDGEFLVRIGMLNPEHLSKYLDPLIEAYTASGSKLFKFIHLPVQSGSDMVLKHMERNYTTEEFYGYVRELRSKVPGISIETDVIVGYPTETREDFEQTERMLLELKPTITNISKFSRRPHARASRLQQRNANEIKERSTLLSREVRAMQASEYAKSIGVRLSVLITEKTPGSFSGRDRFYRPVGLAGSVDGLKVGYKIEAEITGSSYACMLAEPITSERL